jgi:hypothetical protein
MGLRRLKYLYIVSILLLAVLTLMTVFRPMVKGAEYTEVRRDSLLRTGNEWIIQFDIINHEGCEKNYNIEATVNGKEYNEGILVPDKRIFTYIYHIRQEDVSDENVDFAIYREGENVPVKQVSYHLR